MNKAFTLVEILIVVAILGILAAIALPQFQAHAQEAKEAAAKDNLRILRQQIELYAAQHNDVPPGYPNNNPAQNPGSAVFYFQLVKNESYITELPKNPFNDKRQIKVIANGASFPDAPTGDFGWIYKPATKTIRLDWPGTDKNDVSYYDY